MEKNPDCNRCGTTKIYVYDSERGDWVRDVMGFKSPMCPYCDEHFELDECGPWEYSDVFTTCYCCGEDSEAVERHHISYDPEVVKPVCRQCHLRIHYDDDFRPELTPDMTRENAIKEGYISPGRAETTPGEVGISNEG